MTTRYNAHTLQSFNLELEISNHISKQLSVKEFLAWLPGLSISLDLSHYTALFEKLSEWLSEDELETQSLLVSDQTFWLWLQAFFNDVLTRRLSAVRKKHRRKNDEAELVAAATAVVAAVAAAADPTSSSEKGEKQPDPDVLVTLRACTFIKLLTGAPTQKRHNTHTTAELGTFGVCPVLCSILRTYAAKEPAVVTEALHAFVHVLFAPPIAATASSPSGTGHHKVGKSDKHDHKHEHEDKHGHHTEGGGAGRREEATEEDSTPSSSISNIHTILSKLPPAHGPIEALYAVMRANRYDPVLLELALRALKGVASGPKGRGSDKVLEEWSRTAKASGELVRTLQYFSSLTVEGNEAAYQKQIMEELIAAAAPAAVVEGADNNSPLPRPPEISTTEPSAPQTSDAPHPPQPQPPLQPPVNQKHDHGHDHDHVSVRSKHENSSDHTHAHGHTPQPAPVTPHAPHAPHTPAHTPAPHGQASSTHGKTPSSTTSLSSPIPSPLPSPSHHHRAASRHNPARTLCLTALSAISALARSPANCGALFDEKVENVVILVMYHRFRDVDIMTAACKTVISLVHGSMKRRVAFCETTTKVAGANEADSPDHGGGGGGREKSRAPRIGLCDALLRSLQKGFFVLFPIGAEMTCRLLWHVLYDDSAKAKGNQHLTEQDRAALPDLSRRLRDCQADFASRFTDRPKVKETLMLDSKVQAFNKAKTLPAFLLWDDPQAAKK